MYPLQLLPGLLNLLHNLGTGPDSNSRRGNRSRNLRGAHRVVLGRGVVKLGKACGFATLIAFRDLHLQLGFKRDYRLLGPSLKACGDVTLAWRMPLVLQHVVFRYVNRGIM